MGLNPDLSNEDEYSIIQKRRQEENHTLTWVLSH